MSRLLLTQAGRCFIIICAFTRKACCNITHIREKSSVFETMASGSDTLKRANQIWVNLTTIYLYSLLTIYLFYCGTDGYQGITSGKFSMFCLLCGGYILLMGVLGIESILIGTLPLPSPRTLWQKASWTQRFVLIYLALTWASALASPYRPEPILGVSRHEGALTITIYGLCFLLVSVFGRTTMRTLIVFCLSATAFGGLCILQLAGQNPFSLYPAGYSYRDAYTAYSGAYLGTVGNVGLVAAFLCIVIPILWVGVVRLEGRTRWCLLVPLSVLVFILLDMSVLAGLVGVFGGGICMAPVVLPLSQKRRNLLVGVLLAGGIFFLGLIYWVDFKFSLFHELHSILHGSWNETFGSGRIYIWKNVLQQVPQRLWLGTGPDTMLYANITPFTRYDENLGQMLVSHIDMAHNEYLNILFHQGVLALMAYVFALVSATWRWIIHSPTDPVCAMLGGAVLCYCVQAFFGFSMCITAPFFWLTLGLLENRFRTNRGRNYVEKISQFKSGIANVFSANPIGRSCRV